MRKLSCFLNDLVNIDRCHFKISLQIFPRIVLLHLYTGREKAVDSTGRSAVSWERVGGAVRQCRILILT